MQQHYQDNEKYLVVLLTFISILSFYPVIYALIKIHKKRGFEVVLNVMTMISQMTYKIVLVFQINQLFISEESWHKLLNILLLLQFCSLMIYLARIPKIYQGYFMGIGFSIILMIQEKDSQSLKYALIPIIFNNLLLIGSQCMLSGPIYINSRMVVFGAVWYVLSIIAFVGHYHRFLDFFYFFQDFTMFSTGLSLFYSWQTYEKYDLTFDMFIDQHLQFYRSLMSKYSETQQSNKYEGIQKQLDQSEIDNLKHLEQKALKKKEMRKQKKKQQFEMIQEEDEEENNVLLEAQQPSPKREQKDSYNSPLQIIVEMREL